MFDLRFLVHKYRFGPANVKCTKIASKLLHKNEKIHSLVPLLKRYLQLDIEKKEQKSDWFRPDLSSAQIQYAIADVRFLPALLDILLDRLENVGLREFADRCFAHIPTQVRLEVEGYEGVYDY